ncbi:MAG: hypothetical protein JST69_14465 [Bacteroidetes bacterium]|nr:hypothetical protein [Bacteroidota bacterium]
MKHLQNLFVVLLCFFSCQLFSQKKETFSFQTEDKKVHEYQLPVVKEKHDSIKFFYTDYKVMKWDSVNRDERFKYLKPTSEVSDVALGYIVVDFRKKTFVIKRNDSAEKLSLRFKKGTEMHQLPNGNYLCSYVFTKGNGGFTLQYGETIKSYVNSTNGFGCAVNLYDHIGTHIILTTE